MLRYLVTCIKKTATFAGFTKFVRHLSQNSKQKEKTNSLKEKGICLSFTLSFPFFLKFNNKPFVVT